MPLAFPLYTPVPLLQVEVGHDGEGPHAAWHLAWVRITNLDTQETATFECNRSPHPSFPPRPPPCPPPPPVRLGPFPFDHPQSACTLHLPASLMRIGIMHHMCVCDIAAYVMG